VFKLMRHPGEQGGKFRNRESGGTETGTRQFRYGFGGSLKCRDFRGRQASPPGVGGGETGTKPSRRTIDRGQIMSHDDIMIGDSAAVHRQNRAIVVAQEEKTP
jgi:hypothetical protein